MQPAHIQQAFEHAVQQHRAGRLVEAEEIYRKVLSIVPAHADAMHLLGLIAHQVGQHQSAIELIRNAIALDPTNAIAYSNLGEAHRALGRVDEALNAYRQAITRDPRVPDFYNNLCIVLAQRGEHEQAAIECRRALNLRPDWPEAYSNLGNILREQGFLVEASASYRTAIQLRPNYAEAYNSLSNVLRDQGHRVEALEMCRRALHLRPCYPDALHNLGDALKDQGQLDEAIAVYNRALQSKADFPAVYNNLADAFKSGGALIEALAALRKALTLAPNNPGIHSNLIYMLLFFPSRNTQLLAGEQDEWNRRFSADETGAILRYSNSQDPERPLRIGYVSPDFCDHVVGRNLMPLFKHQGRQDFETICYSGVTCSDSWTEQIRSCATRWRNTFGLADDALAQIVREDGVDLLIDLTQHLAGNRLPLFTRNAAPVQASFAGYPESTGVSAICYRISDRWIEQGGVPNGQGEIVKTSAQERVFLIDSFWCYDPCGVKVEVNTPPAKQCGHVTFGSLNNFCKVNEPLLQLWARVLGTIENSRLVLLAHPGSHRKRTLNFLEAEGVVANRVEFVEPRPPREYLELYHQLDIVLDPFPYNGHTTTLDALWMGVPVVSLCGERPVSRAGLSQLTNLGLPELVAHSEDQYVEIATNLANDLPRLTELRATLRKRMESSVLMDGPHFARQIEACYRSMWRQWCAKQQP